MLLPHQIERYQSPAVRNLVWALLSPTLIQSANASHNFPAYWFQNALLEIEPKLQQLDQDDSALLEHLNTPPSHRLGTYFERLWSYWLQHSNRYQLLAANLPIKQEGRTLGEFDFIVHDNASNEIEHWELAVKFYLGISPLQEAHHWFGPHLQDRLDLKFQHLMHKQLPLSKAPPAQSLCRERGWNIARRRLISKGRLYYPPNDTTTYPHCIDRLHLQGRWLTQSAWLSQCGQHPSARYCWLEKADWLVARQARWLSALELQQALALQQHPSPVQLMVEGWYPSGPSRLFVVPDTWQQQALSSLQQSSR